MKYEQIAVSKSKQSTKYGSGTLHKGLSSSNYKELTKLFAVAKMQRLDERLKELFKV